TLEGIDDAIPFEAFKAWLTVHAGMLMETPTTQLREKLPKPRISSRLGGNEIRFDMCSQIVFEALPKALIVADLFTPGAKGDQSLRGFDFVLISLKGQPRWQ